MWFVIYYLTKEISMEIWKKLEIEDYYISNYGNLKKENYKTRKNKNGKEIIVKTYQKENGYLQATIYDKKNKKQLKRYIHRLVAEAFIPNPNNLPCVNHKDGNKQNNCVDNLEWCSYSENVKHAYKNGLMLKKYGEENKNSKIYVELDENYNFIREIIGSRETGKQEGFSRDKISRVARHRVLMTKERKIYLFAEEYYKKDKESVKKNHEEKVKEYHEKRR